MSGRPRVSASRATVASDQSAASAIDSIATFIAADIERFNAASGGPDRAPPNLSVVLKCGLPDGRVFDNRGRIRPNPL